MDALVFQDMIHDAQMDFYGTRLATCSSDRLVKIFDVKVSFFKLIVKKEAPPLSHLQII